MEIFDALLLVGTVLGVLLLLARQLSPLFRGLVILLVALAILQLIFEGARWQVIPLYASTLLLVSSILLQRYFLRVGAAFVVLICAVLTGLTSWAFPIFHVPEPDGEYRVGTTSLEFNDPTRHEAYSQQEDQTRRVMLRVWYPTESGAEPADSHYWEHPYVRSEAVTQTVPLPWFTFSHLGKVKTHSLWDAEVAGGEFPVVIYSHGLGIGWASSNTPLVEKLASHGYIVIGVDHAYLGSAAIFSDQVVTFDPETRAALNSQPPDDVREIYDQVPGETDPEEQLRLYMEAMAMMPVSIKGKVDVALETKVEDQKALIRLLPSFEKLDARFAGHIDASKVGVAGMSVGGCAAIITCAEEPGCDAVINLDGFHPAQANVELGVPSLAMHRPENLLVYSNYSRATAEAYTLRIADTTHLNFFDFTIMSPLYEKMGVLGTIDGLTMVDTVGTYALAFLNKSLKGQESGLLTPGTEPEGLELKRRP